MERVSWRGVTLSIQCLHPFPQDGVGARESSRVAPSPQATFLARKIQKGAHLSECVQGNGEKPRVYTSSSCFAKKPEDRKMELAS